MKRFEFRIDITAHQYLSYYRGAIKQVVVQCTTGATVQFPASLLTQFITESGVYGQFALTCDDDNRSSELKRTPPAII
ncbi:DUF2835 domain-containing protein [bacterium]|jgi:hypothetical protein|nr:DUF2835 domain-containing protein [bacterium]